MGADQQFCLRWNNFHTNITSAFESLRDDEDFVDITLACEGRQIKAHKMVLSACSPYFRSLLRGNPCQHPIVFLKDVTFANLTSILDFMYHGEVNVSHNELATFLKTAEALRVRGLAEDEKKKEGDTCTESSSPPPPRDPPEPCSPGRPDDTGGGEGGSRVTIGDSRSSGGGEANSTTSGDPVGPPPTKRQRRRSGGTGAVAIISAVTGSTSSDHLHHQQQQHDHTGTMNTTSSSSSSHTNNDPMSQHQGDRSVRENVKNEPEDYINDDDDMLGGGGSSSQGGQQQHQQQQPPIAPEDIKLDGFSGEDGSGEYNLTDSVSITSRSQAAIQQQLQDTFSTFIPVAGQNPSFLQGHGNPGSSDHSRHPSFSLEGVQGLPPGISALPGTSMSQGGSSQDGPGQGNSSSNNSAAADGAVARSSTPQQQNWSAGASSMLASPPPSSNDQYHQDQSLLPGSSLFSGSNNSNYFNSISENFFGSSSGANKRNADNVSSFGNSAGTTASGNSRNSNSSKARSVNLAGSRRNSDLGSSTTSSPRASSVGDLSGGTFQQQLDALSSPSTPSTGGEGAYTAGGSSNMVGNSRRYSAESGNYIGGTAGYGFGGHQRSAGMDAEGAGSTTAGMVGSSGGSGVVSNSGEEVQCGVCGRTLCNKYVLKVHIRDMHTPRTQHPCSHCHRSYSTLNSLRVHVTTVHNKHSQQPHLLPPRQHQHLSSALQQQHTLVTRDAMQSVAFQQQMNAMAGHQHTSPGTSPSAAALAAAASGGLKQSHQFADAANSNSSSSSAQFQLMLSPKNEFGSDRPST